MSFIDPAVMLFVFAFLAVILLGPFVVLGLLARRRRRRGADGPEPSASGARLLPHGLDRSDS